MENLHLLSTDKPSRFSLNSSGKYHLTNQLYTNSPNFTNQHIYITSDEEIIGFENNIWVIKGERIFLWQNTMALVSNNKPRKIILTTDQDLIKDSVQAIDDEFLEWFIKNPSCEDVKVVKEGYKKNGMIDEATSYRYKIIIPSEEPKQETLNLDKLESKLDNALAKETKESLSNWLNSKRGKQETLEEAADRIVREYTGYEMNRDDKKLYAILSSVTDKLIKWQSERMYSEEDMKHAFFSGCQSERQIKPRVKCWEEFIEQFKNK